MIHHSHVKCDECQERHTPGNATECIEQLQIQLLAVQGQLLGRQQDADRLQAINAELLEACKLAANVLRAMDGPLKRERNDAAIQCDAAIAKAEAAHGAKE